MKTLIIVSSSPTEYELLFLRKLLSNGPAPDRIIAIAHNNRENRETEVPLLTTRISQEYKTVKLPPPSISRIYLEFDGGRISSALDGELFSLTILDPDDTAVLLAEPNTYLQISKHQTVGTIFTTFKCLCLPAENTWTIMRMWRDEYAVEELGSDYLPEIIEAKDDTLFGSAIRKAETPQISLNDRVMNSIRRRMSERILSNMYASNFGHLIDWEFHRDTNIAALAYIEYILTRKPEEKIIITQDAATMRSISLCRNLAERGLDPVLVVGPTGTGKELFAELYASEYKATHSTKGKFLSINASTIPRELLNRRFLATRRAPFQARQKINRDSSLKREIVYFFLMKSIRSRLTYKPNFCVSLKNESIPKLGIQ
jgi:hypothetical protein